MEGHVGRGLRVRFFPMLLWRVVLHEASESSGQPILNSAFVACLDDGACTVNASEVDMASFQLSSADFADVQ